MAHEAVLDHVPRALVLLERMPAAGARLLRWRLLEVREITLDIQGDRVGQRADIDAMAGLAEAQDDDRRRAHAAWRRSALAHRLADYVEAEAAARQAVEWARRAGDDETRLLAERMLAMALNFQGRPGDGRVIAEEVLAEARALGLRRVEGLCLNALSVMLAMQSDDVGALRLDQQSLAAHRAAGDRRNEAIAQGNIGAGWLGLGELTEARRGLEEGLRLLRANGERALEVSPLCALSTLALWQGDDAHALVQGARPWKQRSRFTRATMRRPPGAGWATPSWRSGGMPRRPRPSPLRMRAPARLPARFGTTPRPGWPGSPWRRATPRRRCRRWRPCWRSLRRPAPMTTRWKARNSRVSSSGPVTGCWRARAGSATVAPPSGWPARTRRFRPRRPTLADAALRQGFLRNIPVHREIVAAWAARDATSSA